MVPSVVIDKKTADIILPGKSRDNFDSQCPISSRQVDKVGSAIGCDDDNRTCGIVTDHAVAAHRVCINVHQRVLCVGIIKGKP